MNSLSVKAKFQIVQFKSLKQIFCKCEGQFDLEGQGQDQQFLNPSESFRCLINRSSWKIKLETVQCLTVKIKILVV